MNRRSAMKAAASLLGVPLLRAAESSAVVSLPARTLLEADPEAYWLKVRDEQFFLPKWRNFLNNGSLGVTPRPVFQAVADYMMLGDSRTQDDYPRWGYETMDAHRQEMADFVGCKKDELALTQSATTAMSIIAAGLDLKQGDEVVMTDQEHGSGKACWQLKAARSGTEVREIKIPTSPKKISDVTDALISGLGPRTRVLSFSSILTTTGLVMPTKEICKAARDKGIITVVDGAHHHGQVPVNIHDLGCDFMAGSPHKWMFAPAGSGLLYISEPWLDRLWPTIVTGGWNDKSMKAARFMMLGPNNRAIMEGMIAGLRFGKSIGYDKVFERMHSLARLTCEKARKIPYIEVVTPADDRTFGSIAYLKFSKDAKPLWDLCAKKKIWTAHSDQGIRFSHHIHTRLSDIEMFFDTVKETLG
jgi:isopenicillin-N epimerase